MNKNLDLFISFFKVGAFTFGGGYAMLPLVKKELSEKKGYISENEIVDMLAVSESTPGSIAVNIATFVGYKIGGVFGSVCSTLGVVMPSFIIISILSFFIEAFKTNLYVSYAFWGVRAAVMALILSALITVFTHTPKGYLAVIIMLASFLSTAFFGISAIYVLIIWAVFGIVRGRRKKA